MVPGHGVAQQSFRRPTAVITPTPSNGLRVVFLDHRPFAACSDWQEAERLAFDLRRFHHARRVAVLQASLQDQILWNQKKREQ